jgi:transcription elongation GreA/GreB family factor
MPTKAALKAELEASLTAALDLAKRAHAAATEAATNPESRAENDKDTRGLEQSYLARGQAMRVAELETALARLAAFAVPSFGTSSRIALGALVTVEDDGDRKQLFIAADGGGTLLANGDVQVVTPQSPLGRALLGRSIDDDIELRLPNGVRTLTVVAIS